MNSKINKSISCIEKTLQLMQSEEIYKKQLAVKQERKNNAVNQYITQALSVLKVAKDFSMNYNSVPIPKGAIYGKIDAEIRIMVTDFMQFHTTRNNTRFTIYLMNIHDKVYAGFRKYTIKKYSALYNMIYAYIEYNKMYSNKVVKQYMIKQGHAEPQIKKAQTDYAFNVGKIGYSLSGKTTTEYSVSDKVRRYVTYNPQ